MVFLNNHRKAFQLVPSPPRQQDLAPTPPGELLKSAHRFVLIAFRFSLMAGGDFVVFSHSFSTILIGQLARLAAAKLPGASLTILVRLQTKIAESLPLLVRFLLTKIEQDLLSTQPLGQETPLDRVKQQRR